MSSKPAVFPLLVLTILLSASSLEAAKSRVRFISNPPGATVTETNLGVLGTTPVDVLVKRGTMLECTFTKEGYESRSKSGLVDQLKMVVRADLPPLPRATVRLGVEPQQASVRLTGPDGSKIYSGESGRVHTLPSDLWGGRELADFRVEIWAPGYEPYEAEVELRNHESETLEFELVQISTLLRVESQPEGARVSETFLGDLGTTPLEHPLSLIDLERARSRRGVSQGDPAHLVLSFSKEGYQTLARQVKVDFAEEANELSVELTPLPGAGG